MKYAIMFLLGFTIGANLLACFGSVRLDRFKREAISLGHAQYNPTNASFEWKAVGHED